MLNRRTNPPRDLSCSQQHHIPDSVTPFNFHQLDSLLRTIIKSTVSQQLDAIFEGVRRLEAKECPPPEGRALLYRLPDVLKLLRVSKSTLYSWLNPQSAFFDATLPQPFKLGGYAHSPVAWRAGDIDAWIESRACAGASRSTVATLNVRASSRKH
jgi:predicted DNA-binding transcriptional regulator AlpA